MGAKEKDSNVQLVAARTSMERRGARNEAHEDVEREREGEGGSERVSD